ncbi:ankyrin-1-like [Phymastichus coffea]|uniref:ankyrin-1-like n=1 Tax=Phymastichus coffea TaxID=108790 RepID=UPI00273AE5D3|nr:ankyrin-1-like [Phymastichus coffea]
MKQLASFEARVLEMLRQHAQDEEARTIIEQQDLHNAVDSTGSTLLHYAAGWRNAAMVQQLIELGGLINVQNNTGDTPLTVAVANGHPPTIKILLRAGADVHSQNHEGKTALTIFATSQCADDELVKMFLGTLSRHVGHDDELMAKVLLQLHWPLHYVVRLGNGHVMELVMKGERSTTINMPNNLGETPLHIAVTCADVVNVHLLLFRPVNINALNVYGHTPLACLYRQGMSIHHLEDQRLQILKLLIIHGAGLCRDQGDWPDIYSVLWYGTKSAVEWLLNSIVHMHALVEVDLNENTLVHLLAVNINPGVIELLQDLNWDPSVRNKQGRTPLMIAARYGNANAVKFLLDEGVYIDAADPAGKTALVWAMAFRGGNRETALKSVQILLERGADPQVSIRGKTIFDKIDDMRFFLVEPIIAHLALQEARGIPLTEPIRNKTRTDEQVKDYYEASKHELKVTVYRSCTLVQLLIGPEEMLEQHVRDQSTYLRILKFTKELQFNYYRVLLKKRIQEAIETVIMKDSRGACPTIRKTD